MATTVLLADDNALLRAGLRGVLEDDTEIELVGVCADLPELEAAATSRTADSSCPTSRPGP